MLYKNLLDRENLNSLLTSNFWFHFTLISQLPSQFSHFQCPLSIEAIPEKDKVGKDSGPTFSLEFKSPRTTGIQKDKEMKPLVSNGQKPCWLAATRPVQSSVNLKHFERTQWGWNWRISGEC